MSRCACFHWICQQHHIITYTVSTQLPYARHHIVGITHTDYCHIDHQHGSNSPQSHITDTLSTYPNSIANNYIHIDSVTS